MKQYCRKH